MRRLIFAPILLTILVSGQPAFATNFTLPDVCVNGATGSPEDDMADGGDPPIPVITYSPRGTTKYYIDEVAVQAGANDSWIASFYSPWSQDYTIITSYTPFLQSHQTKSVVGRNQQVDIPLAEAGSGLIGIEQLHATFTVELGADLKNAFVEMAPIYPGADPITLEADDEGDVTIECYVSDANGNPITVYDSGNEYCGEGVVKPDGKVTYKDSALPACGASAESSK